MSEGVDPAETIAEIIVDDVLLDLLGGAEPDALVLLRELGGPLIGLLAAWAADVRED